MLSCGARMLLSLASFACKNFNRNFHFFGLVNSPHYKQARELVLFLKIRKKLCH